MQKVIIANFGDKKYNIRQRNIRASQEWRVAFLNKVQPVLALITNFTKTKLDSEAEMGDLVQGIQGALLTVMPIIFDALCDYAPEIAEAREVISEEGTDEEVVDAFWEVLKLVFPLGKMLTFNAGLKTPSTLTKSPSPSGG